MFRPFWLGTPSAPTPALTRAVRDYRTASIAGVQPRASASLRLATCATAASSARSIVGTVVPEVVLFHECGHAQHGS